MSFGCGDSFLGFKLQGSFRDGQEVEIKQLSSKSRRTNQEFMDEVQLITSVRHENIVRLRGCAMGPNSRLLVYEYLENRNLAQALFGTHLIANDALSNVRIIFELHNLLKSLPEY